MSSVLLRFASLAKECAAQSIMHGKGRYPRLPCTGSSSSAAVQDTGDRRAALFPQRVGCQKSTDPLETTSSLFLPSCLGLGGKWDSGREGKRRAGGGVSPILFHCFILQFFCLALWVPDDVCVPRWGTPRWEPRPCTKFWWSLICGLYLACGTECNIPLKKQKIPTQNGIPSHFFGGKFHSVKLVSFTLWIPGHIFMYWIPSNFNWAKSKGLNSKSQMKHL